MPDTFIFGSRALKLSKKRRKEIARYMRWVRSLRKYALTVTRVSAAEFMSARKINEREVLAEMLAQGEPKPRLWTENLPDYGPRIERTDAERYEDRLAERGAHTRRALSDMASYRHEGPR